MTELIGTLVDSNVLLDIFTLDPAWGPWSSTALAEAAEAGPLYVNSIIYAEVSIRFSRIEDLDAALPQNDFRRLPISWAAAFLAGKGIPVPSPQPGQQKLTAAGLLHRRSRRRRIADPVDTRYGTVSDLLPDTRNDPSWLTGGMPMELSVAETATATNGRTGESPHS